MAGEHDFRDAGQMLDGVREARMEMIHFRSDAQNPGEIGSLARVCFFHAPEMARRMGEPLLDNEGHPPAVQSSDQALARALAAEVVAARPMAQWLSSHVSDRTRAMFARGSDNAFDVLLDRFAADRGFSRSDALTVEAARPEPGLIDAGRVSAAQRAFAAHERQR